MLNQGKPLPEEQGGIGVPVETSRPESGSPEFDRFLASITVRPADSISLKDWRDLAEAWRITRALESCAGNRSAAARELGIGRRTLYAKMDKLGLLDRLEIA